jgi:hypothetical protein
LTYEKASNYCKGPTISPNRDADASSSGAEFGTLGLAYGQKILRRFGTLIYLILRSDFSPRISFEIVESLDDIRDRHGQLGA